MRFRHWVIVVAVVGIVLYFGVRFFLLLSLFWAGDDRSSHPATEQAARQEALRQLSGNVYWARDQLSDVVQDPDVKLADVKDRARRSLKRHGYDARYDVVRDPDRLVVVARIVGLGAAGDDLNQTTAGVSACVRFVGVVRMPRDVRMSEGRCVASSIPTVPLEKLEPPR